MRAVAMATTPEMNPKAFSDVVGETTDHARFGVVGSNTGDNSFGFIAGKDLVFNEHAGVYGQSDKQGVTGIGTSPGSTGVFGATKDGDGVGVRGGTKTGIAVQGESFGPGLAGSFVGHVEVTGNITANDVVISGGDCAEDFDILGDSAVEPGTVMVIESNGALVPSSRAYDKRVAGVISGAGEYKPGIILDKRHTEGNRMPVALVGKVYCRVDAQYGPIEVGDLLTTSPTTGHAMRVDDAPKAFGAVIGKALAALDTERALIPILVALQ